ncbi:MAG: dTMP kinase [Pseudomonadota bacterium]
MSSGVSKKGLFVTLEGGEGAGKSTQIDMLKQKLEEAGFEVVSTREPGGTQGAEIIRDVILSGAAEAYGPEYEASLFAAARLDHVENLISPSLTAGKIVLCDRFIDSTRVYQGITGRVDMDYLHALEKVVCGMCMPDKTIVLDLEPEEGMKRATTRRSSDVSPDRFEKEKLEIQVKRREAFLSIAKQEPDRCMVVDASGSPDEVHANIWDGLSPTIDRLTSK